MLYFLLVCAFVYGTVRDNDLQPVKFDAAGLVRDMVHQHDITANKTITKTRSIVENVLLDPKKFVAEVAKLDPAALETIITLLQGLLTISEGREETLNTAVNDADNAVSSASNDLANAEEGLTIAKKAVSDSQAILSTKQQEEAISQSVLDGAKQLHTEKAGDRDSATSERDGEATGLNHEQEVLRQVIATLEGLHDHQTPVASDQRAMEFIIENDGEKFYKVKAIGTMIGPNVLAACQAVELVAPCVGPQGCHYNDGNCKVTSLSTKCGDPMATASRIICNTFPTSCDAFKEVYAYMGTDWTPGNGALGAACGVENPEGWCSDGNDFEDKWAWCVTP